MTDWSIPEPLKDRFTKVFESQDANRTGYLSGAQCRDILLQSSLPRTTLAEIWNLSDLDYDGQLNLEEFILAMYLATEVKSGTPIPKELPADLIPPSFRRNRSASGSAASTRSSSTLNSAHLQSISTSNTSNSPTVSATSNPANNDLAGSGQRSGSISVFSSNSFEDKRRENYEKGRVELEKRRLKVVEEQIAIFEEQLSVSKKQVTDAKTEIDTMRSDRDVKTGVITTLEAQLLSIQDKKSRLEAEEKNLETVAEAAATAAAAAAKNQFKEVQDHFVAKSHAPPIGVVVDQQDPFGTSSQSNNQAEFPSLSDPFEQHKPPQDFSDPFADDPFGDSTKPQELPVFNQEEITSITSDVPLSKTNSSCETKLEQPSATTSIIRYRVLYPFEARSSDELNINPDDIITYVEGQYEPGWLGGQLNGQKGLFPESFVELMSEGDNDLVIDKVVTTTENNNELILQTQALQISDESSAPIIRYKALFPFTARNVDELTINPGDIIVATVGEYEPGWLGGELNGNKGLFPESFVEQITEPTEHSASQLQRKDSVSSLKSKKKSVKKAEVATVIANYMALGSEQLNLEKGQLVMIRRKMDSGWWEGEVQVKGKKKQFGWFPASYVKLLTNASS